MFKRFLWFLIVLSIYSAAGLWPFALAEEKSSFKAFSAYFEAGERAFFQGNYSYAVSAYQSALAVQPNQPRAIFRMAQSLAAMEKYFEAYSQFQYLSKLQPENTSVRFEMAKCLLKMGNQA